MYLKYIIVANMFPIIFHHTLAHDLLALEDNSITSAGFCSIYTDDKGHFKVHCWGNSLTLHKSSNGEADAEILRQMLVGQLP